MLTKAVSSSLAALTDLVRATAGSTTWAPVVNVSRRAVCMLLSRIEHGQLSIIDVDGGVIRFGDGLGDSTKGKKVELRVQREAFWVRLFLFSDMGFSEAFMLGDVECADLVSFFQIFILNRSQLANATTLTSSVMSTITGLARSTNTLSNSLLNVSAHYDISNDMFAAFLSDDMTYSCPIWAPKSSPDALTDTLETAQKRKLQRFISNAHIKGTDLVMEIGTGWGSFAIEAVRSTGCTVTSLTLSVEQKELAEKRIAAAGFASSITVLLCDYRELPTPKVLFDKVVSIEMLEAVGSEFLVTYFECVNRLLKPKGGVAVFQCITMPESRYEAYAKSEDFIQKYIFPGGHLPTVSQLVGAIDKGSKNTLIVDQIENIGGHYAKTLRLWNQKFQQNFDARIKPALLQEHDNMTSADTELFRRKWEYYFSYSEAGFSTKTLGDVIITAAREGTMEMLEDIVL